MIAVSGPGKKGEISISKCLYVDILMEALKGFTLLSRLLQAIQFQMRHTMSRWQCQNNVFK